MKKTNRELISELAEKYYDEDEMCLSDLILLLEEYEANRNPKDKSNN